MAWWCGGVVTHKEPGDMAKTQCPTCKLYFHGPCGSCDVADLTAFQQLFCSVVCWRNGGSPGDPKCVIWSNEHNAWWAPNSRGYVVDRKSAGRYIVEEAKKICEGANRNTGPGTAKTWDEIWMYDPDWVEDLYESSR